MKAKFGSIIVDGSGSLGGMCVTHNNSSAILRVKGMSNHSSVKYTNPVKARMQYLATQWQWLFADETKAWRDAKFQGMSGFRLYMHLNGQLLSIGQSMLTLPPDSINVVPPERFTVIRQTPPDTFVIQFVNPISQFHVGRIYVTEPISYGVTNPGKRWFNVANAQWPNIIVTNITAPYTARYGGIGSMDMLVHVKVINVEIATGATSEAIYGIG